MPQPLLWAVDFGERTVVALAAHAKPDGSLSLAGSAQLPTLGLSGGEFTNAGDVTECLVEVLRTAEKSCGSKCRSVYFNFDDALLESRFPTGSRMLAGEGQVRSVDVEQAVSSARRSVGNFEKSVVYSGRTHFLIDGKDSVINPVGVFGRQLEVQLHVLMARAERLETWQKVIERAHLKSGTPVLSILSSVYGVLEAHQRGGKRVVCDLGGDVLAAAVLENGALQNYSGLATHGMSGREAVQWAAAVCRQFESKHGVFEEVLLTGDLAAQESPFPNARVAAPLGLTSFDRTEHAAVVGLLRVAAETRSHVTPHRDQQHRMDHLRQKAVTLINEYF